MAKVEMSLSEYNEMKGELDFLRRVVKEITTPRPNQWDLDWIQNCGYTKINCELTAEVSDFLNQKILENLPSELVTQELQVVPLINQMEVVRVERIQIEKTEDSEESSKG